MRRATDKTVVRGCRAIVVSLLLAMAPASCGEEARDPVAAVPSPPSPPACLTPERAGADGSCELFASLAACPAGTRPAVGSEGCVAVGPTTCAPGFERDASGWGCAPILPEAPCTGASRPRLGDRTCVPVGDCAALFPASGSIVVDPTLVDAALDATHVRTVADAVAIAAEGATIALADGSHVVDALTITKPLTIAGRCAERARVLPAQPAASYGVLIRAKVAMRGLTFEGHTEALSVTTSGELLAEDVVVEHARSRAVFAQRTGKATLRRSVVRGTAPLGASDQTIAVLVGSGGRVDLEDSAILASVDGALAVTDSASTRATLTRSVVQDVRPRADGKGGGALRAFEGAHLEITESAILGASGIAILTLRRNGPPPEVTLKRSVVGGTAATRETGTAIGTAINAAYGALVQIEESTISDTEGTGLYAAETARIALEKSAVVRVKRTVDLAAQGGSAVKGGQLSLEDSAVVRVGALGLGGWEGGRVTLARSLVRDIGGDVVQNLPMGQGLNAAARSSVDATDSAIVDALEIGASASKAGSAVRFERVLVTRSAGMLVPRFGHGVLAVDSATFFISRSIVERQIGVGLFFASGGGVVGSSLIRDNAVAVQVQEGSTLLEAAARPESVPEQDLVITTDTRFVGNASRLGSGVLPLPAVLPSP